MKNPWTCVDVSFESQYRNPLSLQEIKELPDLGECALTRKGCRLSVIPLSEVQFRLLEEAIESRNGDVGDGDDSNNGRDGSESSDDRVGAAASIEQLPSTTTTTATAVTAVAAVVKNKKRKLEEGIV